MCGRLRGGGLCLGVHPDFSTLSMSDLKPPTHTYTYTQMLKSKEKKKGSQACLLVTGTGEGRCRGERAPRGWRCFAKGLLGQSLQRMTRPSSLWDSPQQIPMGPPTAHGSVCGWQVDTGTPPQCPVRGDWMDPSGH